MSREECIKKITELLESDYKEPVTYYDIPPLEFRIQSYSHWTLCELLEYILKNKNFPIVDIIEDFRYQMDIYACTAKTAEANFIFSIAYDVTTDVLDFAVS